MTYRVICLIIISAKARILGDEPMNKWTSIVLAGGQSRRMGTSKALLDVNGQTLIERTVALVTPFSEHIVVVTNNNDDAQVKEVLMKQSLSKPKLCILTDEQTVVGKGPLAGMYTGMKTVQVEHYFVVACDMPNLTTSYLEGLYECLQSHQDYDAMIPIEGDKYHPFAAVYKNKADQIKQLLDIGNHRWLDLFERMEKPYIIDETEWKQWSPSPDLFLNMNKPAQHDQWLKNNKTY